MNALDGPRHARISTRSGQVLDLLNPTADTIDLDDVALGLARRARWSGQTRRYLSVAEHSCAVATRAEQLAAMRDLPHSMRSAAALGGLLHDASEAFFPDVPSPLKEHLFVVGPTGPEMFAVAEERLLEEVRRIVGIHGQWWATVAPLVKQADREVLRIEAEAEMHGVDHWRMPPPAAPDFHWTPECWGMDAARLIWAEHLSAERSLFEQRVRAECGVMRAGGAA